MNSNLKKIADKWPSWRIDKTDERVVDISECAFVGEGRHEIVAYSFARYLPDEDDSTKRVYPICIRFAIHFPGYVSLEEPAIGHLRSGFFHSKTGMLEPAKILAIISCPNGRVLWDRLHAALTSERQLAEDYFGNETWISSNRETLMRAAQQSLAEPFPEFTVESPPEGCHISISIDDIPEVQFPAYYPSQEELSPTRVESWIYHLKKSLKKGGNGIQSCRERVVLKEDLRRADDSLFIGQLGWTVLDPGFRIKKGRSTVEVFVAFDSGITLAVEIYWIDFLQEESAKDVSAKMIASRRGTPFDAEVTVAATFQRDLPFYDAKTTQVVGKGLEEVYAYTFKSCIDKAKSIGQEFYPVKIGYAYGYGEALSRINGLVPSGLANDATILFIGRCDDGRTIESKIHKHIRAADRKIKSSPGTEWFMSSAEEVAKLFSNFCLSCDEN